jgi:hypothetical protein
MEPQKSDRSVKPHGEGQTSPPRQPVRKRPFQIVKLEERIAPGHGNSRNGHYSCRCR